MGALADAQRAARLLHGLAFSPPGLDLTEQLDDLLRRVRFSSSWSSFLGPQLAVLDSHPTWTKFRVAAQTFHLSEKASEHPPQPGVADALHRHLLRTGRTPDRCWW